MVTAMSSVHPMSQMRLEPIVVVNNSASFCNRVSLLDAHGTTYISTIQITRQYKSVLCVVAVRHTVLP